MAWGRQLAVELAATQAEVAQAADHLLAAARLGPALPAEPVVPATLPVAPLFRGDHQPGALRPVGAEARCLVERLDDVAPEVFIVLVGQPLDHAIEPPRVRLLTASEVATHLAVRTPTILGAHDLEHVAEPPPELGHVPVLHPPEVLLQVEGDVGLELLDAVDVLLVVGTARAEAEGLRRAPRELDAEALLDEPLGPVGVLGRPVLVRR